MKTLCTGSVTFIWEDDRITIKNANVVLAHISPEELLGFLLPTEEVKALTSLQVDIRNGAAGDAVG